MAAMQHEIAIVTTRTTLTEESLTRDGALAFAPADDPVAFAAEAIRLARDARARSRQARAGREMYERYFSWPVVAAGLRSAVSETFRTGS
jgi:glycosyltransferase involved in cell wall biosynthesis